MSTIYAFPPLIGENPRILILGTMPGTQSLKEGQYYAHPQNQFWRLMGEVFGGSPKDDAGRRITDPSAGPLFSDEEEDGDLESGTIYVLRSHSDHPFIKEHREIIHKIGVTGGDVNKRIANAKLDSTFLMADVEVIATYKLFNINRVKLEKLIHRFFESTKLELAIPDRFGNSIIAREWFLVPLFVIDDAVEKIKDGSIVNFYFDAEKGRVTPIESPTTKKDGE